MKNWKTDLQQIIDDDANIYKFLLFILLAKLKQVVNEVIHDEYIILNISIIEYILIFNVIKNKIQSSNHLI